MRGGECRRLPRGEAVPHPTSTVQRGIQSAEGEEIGPQRPLCPRNSPHPRPKPSLRLRKQSARTFPGPGSEVGSGVPFLPRPTRREFELPAIKVAARPAAGWQWDAGCWLGAGEEGGPGRPPRATAVPRTSGSAATVAPPRLQLSHRVAGEGLGEGEGSGEGRGGAWLLVPCACAERRRALDCSPLDRPRKAACSIADHRRVSPPVRRLIRGAPAAPGSPSAVRSLLAACRPQLQARRGLRRGTPQSSRSPAPRHPMPGAGPPAQPGSAPGSRRTRLLTKHRARSPLSRVAAAAEVRDQLSLASSALLGPRRPDPAS